MPMDILSTVTTAATPDLTQSLRNTGKNERPDCIGQFARIATFAPWPPVERCKPFRRTTFSKNRQPAAI
jgi:hypothetical protein